ncbi:MAG TPA: 50S ribosomal protein L9 [Candidatus Binatia bacterium]|jgi:large subunit ribosomal protein L9|nr:50S ribosomal protein L9 [Candidatus Binatia bacterium]
MEIILQEDVENLGQIGDVVKVRDGFARNYLLPRGLALEANRRNLRVLEHQKRLVAAKKERTVSQAQTLSAQLAALTVVVTARAGEEDRLFGSVTNLDIEKALKAQGVAVDRKKILLEEPIKQLGTHTVPVQLSGGVRGNVTVQVVRES